MKPQNPADAASSDSVDARERILQAALQVFASKGYGQASTREICRKADVNVAGIHYYFGDKASLYQELFRIPERMIDLPPALDLPETTLQQGLSAWYNHVMGFALGPEDGNQLRLLFLREQMEPSGVLAINTVGIIGLFHAQLVRFLVKRLGLEASDTALHQLAYTLLGMAMVFFVERDAIRQLTPDLLASQSTLNQLIDRIVGHAVAVVEAERSRRSEEAK